MGTTNLKSLIIAASEKLLMNGVSNIKEIYPDSTIFESIEEFESHVVDRAVEYLTDNYPDEEEYSSGTWMLATACDWEGDWLFHIDGEYYIMDYCDLDNEEVNDVQVYIWDNNIEEFASCIAEELNVETVIEVTNHTFESKILTLSTILVNRDEEYINNKNEDNMDNEKVVIGKFKNGENIEVTKSYISSLTNDEEYTNWDIFNINTNIEELIKSIVYSGFGLTAYNTGDFNNIKYYISDELVGKMNFMYDVNIITPEYSNSIYLKVTDNNDGTVSIGLVFEPSPEDKKAMEDYFKELNKVAFTLGK